MERSLNPERRQRYEWMKYPRALAVIAFSILGSCPAMFAQCNSLKTGDTLWVRLLEPLSSYSGKAGDKIHAMVIESPSCDGAEEIAAGTIVEGEVVRVTKVGMGLVHETASIHVEFRSLQLNDGGGIAISAHLLEIDNAREKVKDGIIRGVNATDTPQGRITNRLKHLPTWNPYSDLTVLAYRTAFPTFPEPEIYLPRGSDLKLELADGIELPENAKRETENDRPDEIAKAVLEITAPELPVRTTTRYGQDADIVNVALLGSASQMDAAFHAAGWTILIQHRTSRRLPRARWVIPMERFTMALQTWCPRSTQQATELFLIFRSQIFSNRAAHITPSRTLRRCRTTSPPSTERIRSK